ncbi:sensor histidine kinase [Oceanirhabdus seepicola]|uniref:Sensor histidine kinase n=1 Tax=Oceanirhabdus seepicola TaxID=2828781 RepID=A0A9J6NZG0_9CLOT|nr:sensor histidine kinase [Oceanirhabdus seepicola]MCM1989826.1 sensor histidine kinase [Oceanirhabdus seepicola]
MILAILVITAVFGATNIYSYINGKEGLEKFSHIIDEYVYLNELGEDIITLETEVEKYLSSKSSAALLNYYNIHSKLSEKAKAISRDNSFSEYDTMMKDISYMIDEMLKEADEAINAKRGRSSSEYNNHFIRTYKISEYIKFYVNNLLNNKLKTGSIEYEVISSNQERINVFNILFIVMVIVFSIITAVVFTYKITQPIIDLSNAAEQISKGNYDIEHINVETHDELKTLATGFTKMADSIKLHIEGIKTQAETEKRLKEQEMQNLKMKNLLKDAELKSLQSQINPHFLFNTLNAASQLSAMEGADRSSEFILKAAELFRYSLRKLEEPVTIMEEVNNVSAYMYILKTRFGDRISFSVDVDESVKEQKIPCTIIQPIVENAYIHGLEEIEEHGEILLKVKDYNDTIEVTVKDNGAGMEKDKVMEILNPSGDKGSSGHVTGIGTQNVIDRLKLFYGISDTEDIIHIESQKGVGTSVTLKIPKGNFTNIKGYGV